MAHNIIVMTSRDKKENASSQIKLLLKTENIRSTLFIYGERSNFSFYSNHPTLYLVPLSECDLFLNLIPPSKNNLVVITAENIDSFEAHCSDSKLPIKSSVMLVTGDFQSDVEVWDVYRVHPSSEIRYSKCAIWSHLAGFIWKSKEKPVMRRDLTGVHLKFAAEDGVPFTKIETVDEENLPEGYKV